MRFTGGARTGAGLAAMLLAVAGAVTLAQPLDAWLYDTQVAFNRQYFPQAIANDVVVVGIDEAFVDSIEEPLALSHRYLAEFLRTASGAGSAVIGLDVVLPDKRFAKLRHTDDAAPDFHRTLLAGLLESMRSAPIVIAKVWDKERGHFHDIQIDFAQVLGMQEGVRATASALVLTDPDGRVRRYAGADVQPGGSAATLSAEMSAALVPRRDWQGLIDWQLGDPFSYMPLQEVLRLARTGDNARLNQLFKGKAVLLGTVQHDVDLVRAPVPMASWRPGDERVPGVLVHAQALRSMLKSGFISQVPIAALAALALLFAQFWWGQSVRVKSALLLVASGGAVAASTVLLQRGVWLPVCGMLMAGWSMMLLRTAIEAWRSGRAAALLRARFSGSVSPAVMQAMLDGRLGDDRAGAKREVCVLFSDIRGFTSISEQLPGEQVVALLNRYFARMTPIVHKHGGTLDKYIGDGMMAFFGAPNVLDEPERAALEAAHDMLDELRLLNQELAAEGIAALRIGVGVHSGSASLGYIGAPDRNAYTAVGDTVNIAARLESMCKDTGYQIVCSDSVATALGNPAVLTALGAHPLKGRNAPVMLFGWNPELPGSAQPA